MPKNMIVAQSGGPSPVINNTLRGIVETGQRMLKVGREHVGGRAEVTVSVSSHVPKPHTPLQWCAQDSEVEIRRKQQILRHTAREPGLRLKHHHSGISFVEGVLARGDRRLADALRIDGDGEGLGLDPVGMLEQVGV